MKVVLYTVRAAALSCLLMASLVHGQEYNAPEAEGQGQIQALDFGENSAVVNGLSYQVSPSVRVQISGSYGAFTMLEEGMNITFTFLQYSNGEREIIEIDQVAQVEQM